MMRRSIVRPGMQGTKKPKVAATVSPLTCEPGGHDPVLTKAQLECEHEWDLARKRCLLCGLTKLSFLMAGSPKGTKKAKAVSPLMTGATAPAMTAMTVAVTGGVMTFALGGKTW